MNQQKPVIIFGTGALARLLFHALVQDTGREVAGFTVDHCYVESNQFLGLPLVPFEEIASHFAPASHEMLVPIGYTDINGVRMRRCEQAKALGYVLTSYVSSRASTWQVTPRSGNIIIYEGALIQAFVSLGENVIVRAGVNLGHDAQVGDHAYLASGVVTGGNTKIGERAVLGLGAVVRDGVTITPRCLIGAGAVVVADTEPDGVYMGVPARRVSGKTAAEVTA